MPAFLQRYLGKDRVEDITYGDFRGFLAQGLEEHQTLEYKSGEVILLTADGKLKYPTDQREIAGVLEVAKAVAGLANAEGGLLVLGVRQKPERHGRSIVRIRPGAVKGVPGHVTREVIENVLRAKIQYPIDGLTIAALRPSPRHRWFVYLLDVPQSSHPPHRVAELHYFQRRNFSTDAMLHYQIADLYGRRLGPDLDVETDLPEAIAGDTAGEFLLRPNIRNRGNVVAEYVTAVCALRSDDAYTIIGSPDGSWIRRPDGRSAQFTMGPAAVVYPDTPSNTGALRFGPTSAAAGDVHLVFYLYAKAMAAKTPLVVFTSDVLPKRLDRPPAN